MLKHIGQLLRQWRRDLRYKQVEVAESVSLTGSSPAHRRTNLSKWERGANPISLRDLEALMEHYGRDLWDLAKALQPERNPYATPERPRDALDDMADAESDRIVRDPELMELARGLSAEKMAPTVARLLVKANARMKETEKRLDAIEDKKTVNGD